MTGLIQAEGKITSAALVDGSIAVINDHVYMASEFAGEPFYIGRIMEFGKPVSGRPLQARIGWYYRPKDVMARKNHDPRLLIATMHSDMNPITSIRGRCTVTHQAYIKDMDNYRRKSDHFYYSQLFDRYIHRFYDVLPVETVRNLPPDVADELGRRYQYIVVEAGTASEYTDAHRVCVICKRWCASGEALKCIMCLGFHHMLCINPPMLRKPAKGFAFQCALCTKLVMDSASSTPMSTPYASKLTPMTNISQSAQSSVQSSPKGSPKQKALTLSTQTSCSSSRNDNSTTHLSSSFDPKDQKMSHMWPFRYFGTHADIRDIFDPDDRVYPRAASRVGTRYQAVVAKWEGPGQILPTSSLFDDPQNNGYGSRSRSRRGGRGGRMANRPRATEVELSENYLRAHSASLESATDGPDTPLAPSSPARSAIGVDETIYQERGGDETVSLQYSKPHHISDEFVTSYMERVRALSLPLPCHSADLIDRALLLLQKSGFDADKAIEELGRTQKQDFDIEDWTSTEVEAFEEGIRTFGHELFAIKEKVETRSMKDIVRFFYQWKKTERYQPVYSVFTMINKPNKKFKSVGRGTVTSPSSDPASRTRTYGGHDASATHDKAALECAHCGTVNTRMWRRAPGETDKEKEFPRVFCNDCGNDWLRYVSLPAVIEPPKDGRKYKNKDLSATAGSGNKAPNTSSELPISIKRKRGEGRTPTTKRIKEQSYPVLFVYSTVLKAFSFCRVKAVISQFIMTYQCVLCSKSSHRYPQALKRTTGNNWAHVLCAVWIPEVSFVDMTLLSPIESIGSIRLERWKQVCSICKQQTGACVSCGEGCKRVFHVTCAQEAGYVVAFEMQPAKNVKGGLMVPRIWCPIHDLSSHKVIRIRDQPDALTDRTALLTYVHYYKQSDPSIPLAMRKSRQLQSLNPAISVSSSLHVQGSRRLFSLGAGAKWSTTKGAQGQVGSSASCSLCHTTASSIWWNTTQLSETKSEKIDSIK
ncbi:putative PHD type zinc finger protein with BAH domain-containing protein, partial [Lunasporangiospora selenospora]